MKAHTLPTPTGLYCYICRDQEVSTAATRLCNERRKPACPKHAAGCYEDGHGTSELEIPMIEKLTDAEVLCAWMEPKPTIESFNWSGRSKLGFWVVNPTFNDRGEPAAEVAPVLSSLGYHKEHLYYLHCVEERLTGSGMALSNDDGGQWLAYQRALIDATNDDMYRLKSVIHATPEQKIKALAAILRPIVEGGAL